MKREIATLQNRLYLAASIILSVGLVSSLCIFLTAGNGSNDDLVAQFEGSKIYRHNLELIGGKMNVLADDFLRWFNGLWHGRSLALTVAFLSVLVSLCFFLIARHVTVDSESDPGQAK